MLIYAQLEYQQFTNLEDKILYFVAGNVKCMSSMCKKRTEQNKFDLRSLYCVFKIRARRQFSIVLQIHGKDPHFYMTPMLFTYTVSIKAWVYI